VRHQTFVIIWAFGIGVAILSGLINGSTSRGWDLIVNREPDLTEEYLSQPSRTMPEASWPRILVMVTPPHSSQGF
jgi:hypothetical protein